MLLGAGRRVSSSSPWAPSCRAKAASCPRPAITSRSCGRATTGCRKSCRGSTSCSWTTTSSDSRSEFCRSAAACDRAAVAVWDAAPRPKVQLRVSWGTWPLSVPAPLMPAPHGRWRISKTRTCCCEPSCGTTAWRSSSRVTVTSGGPGGSGPRPCAGLQTPRQPQASPALRPALARASGRPRSWLGAGGAPRAGERFRGTTGGSWAQPATPLAAGLCRLRADSGHRSGVAPARSGPVTGSSEARRRCWARALAAAQGMLGSGGCQEGRRPAAEASGAGRTTGRASRDRSLRGRSFSFPFSFLPFFLF